MTPVKSYVTELSAQGLSYSHHKAHSSTDYHNKLPHSAFKLLLFYNLQTPSTGYHLKPFLQRLEISHRSRDEDKIGVPKFHLFAELPSSLSSLTLYTRFFFYPPWVQSQFGGKRQHRQLSSKWKYKQARTVNRIWKRYNGRFPKYLEKCSIFFFSLECCTHLHFCGYENLFFSFKND